MSALLQADTRGHFQKDRGKDSSLTSVPPFIVLPGGPIFHYRVPTFCSKRLSKNKTQCSKYEGLVVLSNNWWVRQHPNYCSQRLYKMENFYRRREGQGSYEHMKRKNCSRSGHLLWGERQGSVIHIISSSIGGWKGVPLANHWCWSENSRLANKIISLYICCAPETNIILWINYTSEERKREGEREGGRKKEKKEWRKREKERKNGLHAWRRSKPRSGQVLNLGLVSGL